jgi:hypothetical protein
MPPRAIVLLVLGALMLALGAFVIGRLVVTGGALTGNKWIDGAFALFFLLRGAQNVAAAARLRRGAGS